VLRSVSVQGVEDVLFVGAEKNRKLGQFAVPNGIINRLARFSGDLFAILRHLSANGLRLLP
jgi:hypothetical protein